TIDPKISDQKYIDFGKHFYCIAQIVGTTEENTLFAASCVILDDHHILTAAHIVEKYKICFVIINDKKNEVSTITRHPDFKADNFGIADIALGYCKTSFNLDGYPALYTDNNEDKKLCAIAGYGITGTFATGGTKFDNKLRAGSNKIDYIIKDLLICSPSQPGSSDRTALEFCIGSGDSGGGLFIDGKLAGINSCIMSEKRSPSSRYGDESGHTRISKFADWIEQSKTK
ncbi:hypothetical protein EB001_26745, partial [bacterium]|nr:hypothetical protein [bacterium]